jgi:protein TonB
MPRFMFQDVVCPHADSRRRWYTLPLSFGVHTAILVVLVVIPLVAGDVLPSPRSMTAFVTPPPLPAAPPVAVQRIVPVTSILPTDSSAAPLVAPTHIGPENGVIAEPDASGIATPGVIDGVAGAGVIDALPPLPPPAVVEPLRVGGGILAPAKIRDAMPVYPPIAQSARVQGDVIIEATIGADGKVQNARVLRSVPLLDQAAVAAVEAWEYTPTRLNGQAVPVIMVVTVRFRLH